MIEFEHEREYNRYRVYIGGDFIGFVKRLQRRNYFQWWRHSELSTVFLDSETLRALADQMSALNWE